MTEGIVVSVTDHIGRIELNRPAKKNAFTAEMLVAWGQAYRDFQQDDEVRVVVLTATGDAFCAGADLTALRDGASTPLASRALMTEHVHPVAFAADALTKPLIVGMNGDAVGAGLDMALAGDYRLAADTARFSEGYIRVGLVPGDGGCHYLPPIVGRSRALRMLWTGEFVDAKTGLDWRLVDEVHPFDELPAAVTRFAERLAAQPPVAVSLIKQAVRAGRHGDLRMSLDLIASHQAVVQSTADSAEAMAAFLGHRTGEYQGR